MKISVDNAYKKVSKRTKKKNNKIRQKKNFKTKDENLLEMF